MGSGHAKQLILGAAYGDHFEVKNEDIGLITPISGTLILNNQKDDLAPNKPNNTLLPPLQETPAALYQEDY